jgi:hypothetical protein
MNTKAHDAMYECSEGRVTAETFTKFLIGYVTYWRYCHAKGRLPEETLNLAEQHAIRYAKEHGMKLRFGEMTFRLKNDW